MPAFPKMVFKTLLSPGIQAINYFRRDTGLPVRKTTTMAGRMMHTNTNLIVDTYRNHVETSIFVLFEGGMGRTINW